MKPDLKITKTLTLFLGCNYEKKKKCNLQCTQYIMCATAKKVIKFSTIAFLIL